MAAANKFEIQIVALDKATQVFRKVNTSMTNVMRPATRLQRQLGMLSKEAHLDKLTKGFSLVSREVSKVADSLGLAAGPLEALSGLGAAGGVVAALGAAATAAVVVTQRWGDSGAAIKLNSELIGINAQKLQVWERAAKQAGMAQGEFTDMFRNFAQIAHQGIIGDNAQAYQMLMALGVKPKRLKDGSFDMDDLFRQVMGGLANYKDPQARARLASVLGVQNALPLIVNGRSGLDKLYNDSAAMGAPRGDNDLTNATAYRQSRERLGTVLGTKWDRLGGLIGPGAARAMDSISDMLEGKDGGSGALYTYLQSGAWGADFASGMLGAGGVDSAGSAPRFPVKRNNPGNLMNPGGNGFQSFPTSGDGLLAMRNQLLRYQDVFGLNTVRGIVGRYASGSYPGNSPATEAGYIADLVQRTGFGADQALDLHDPATLSALMAAMVRHEQGGRQPFGAGDYQAAATGQRVKVDVTFSNAPPGTTARISEEAGGLGGHLRISHVTPGAP
jgi:hypothetical protein